MHPQAGLSRDAVPPSRARLLLWPLSKSGNSRSGPIGGTGTARLLMNLEIPPSAVLVRTWRAARRGLRSRETREDSEEKKSGEERVR